MSHDGREVGLAEASAPLSVALVSPGWPRQSFANGIIPYVADIAHSLREAGHTVTVVALASKEPVDGVDVIEVRPFDRLWSLPTRFLDVLTFRASLVTGERRVMSRSLSVDCRKLISHRGLQLVEIEESFGLPLDLQKALPIPVVVRLHGPWFVNGPLRGAVEDDAFRRRVALEGRTIRLARAVTAPSVEVLERVRAYYGLVLEKAEVIPNPTPVIPEVDRWSLEGSDRETILFVGRFDRHKGGDVIIDAFARLLKKRPTARLDFAGPDSTVTDADGRAWSLVEYIQARVPEAYASGRVRALSFCPPSELAVLRKKARVSVVCSRYETFGLTLAESMALGCPTIATRVGAFPELMADGVNGLLCRPEDPDDLAEKLEQLFVNDELSIRLGRRAATEINDRLDPARIAAQTAEFYRTVIRAGVGTHRGRSTR